jgi:hypothetical protein
VADASPPFAPVRATFPCPALLALAARAPLGGPRESLLGAVQAVRLVMGARPPFALDPATRATRAEGARGWLTALTLPARTRTAILRAFAASSGDDPHTAADALAAVMEVTAPHLDRLARSELGRVVEGLRRSPASLPGPASGP